MKTVYLSDYLSENKTAKDNDCALAIYEALSVCKEQNAQRLVIEEGIYHVYPDYCFERFYYVTNNDAGMVKIAFPLIGFKDFTIEADGAELVFHGRITPFIVDSCENIRLSGFSVSFHRPFFLQGTILASTETSLDIKVDKDIFNYQIKNGVLRLDVEGFITNPILLILEYLPDTGRLAYRSNDNCCPESMEVEELSEGVIRLKTEFTRSFTPGNIAVMIVEPRSGQGIAIINSKNTVVDNVNIHGANGMAITAQLSEDVTLTNVKVIPKPESGLYASANADATHFVNCTGTVLVEDCIFEGQMDDPLNCHGIYNTITAISKDRKQIIVKYHHMQQVGVNIYKPEDEITFLSPQNYMEISGCHIMKQQFINASYQKLWLKNPLPAEVTIGHAVENRSRMCDLIVRRCTMGKNRARGMLISTCGKVLVEDNTFNVHGTAILIEGADVRFWFESGVCRDLTVRGNVFINCMDNNWGEAVISITPDENIGLTGTFHKNIKIIGNTFHHFDTNILAAGYVDGIEFIDNTVEQTYDFKPFSGKKSLLSFNKCTGIKVMNNTICGFDNIPLVEEKM